MEKSVVLLTNFFDANSLIDQGYLLYPVKDSELYKINLYSSIKDGSNYSVYSVALSHPELTNLKNISSITRLDVFCPTYDLLKRYKENSDWEAYTRDYMALLKVRKNRMAEWMDSLISGRVYILCCWENTSGKAHCHREILYKVMTGSKTLSKKAIVIYRKGNEIKKKRPNLDDFAEGLRPEDVQPIYVSNQMSRQPMNDNNVEYF